MHIAIACDHRGYPLINKVRNLLTEFGQTPIDLGPEGDGIVDYPDYGARVAGAVSRGEVDRGILICGTGVGMCIVANKFPGVRAADCHNDLLVEMARRHNDVNVLCLPADLLGERPLDRMIELFLTVPFESGRHARRTEKITDIERQVSFLTEDVAEVE